MITLKNTFKIVTLAASIATVTACANSTNAQRGAGIGAVVGAIAGKATGDNDKSRYAWGAAIGAIAGGAIGNYMDAQEDALREELADTGVDVVRDGDTLELIMPGNLTFNTDSAAVSSTFYPVLDDVATVLNEFENTRLSVEGHTDAVGKASYNQSLSIERANSVAQYLASQDIDPNRLRTIGRGESNPIADNMSEVNREQNRRVELKIIPVS